MNKSNLLAATAFRRLDRRTARKPGIGGSGLWDDEDGFYYDQLKINGSSIPLRTRSLVGLLPPIAVEVLETAQIDHLPGFHKRMQWFLNYRKDDVRLSTYYEPDSHYYRQMLAIPTEERLKRALSYMLDVKLLQNASDPDYSPAAPR